MRVSIIQTKLFWEQPDQNRAMLAEKITPLCGRTDLIILPEMFSTGFSMQAETLAELENGPGLAWMAEQSARSGAALTGSIMCGENGRFYNKLVWMLPDGRHFSYHKKHLFSLAGEHKHYQPGTERLMVEWRGWRICPLICYDLRFPVWSRNRKNDPYDLLIYVANWPQARSHHWKSLLTARAIENQSFVIGVNIVGTDGKGLVYSGDSGVIDFSGTQICQISGGEGTLSTELSLEEMRAYRQQLPFLEDGDLFQLF